MFYVFSYCQQISQNHICSQVLFCFVCCLIHLLPLCHSAPLLSKKNRLETHEWVTLLLCVTRFFIISYSLFRLTQILTRAPNLDTSAGENSLLSPSQWPAVLFSLIKSTYLLGVFKSFSESRWADDAVDCSGNVQIAGFALFKLDLLSKNKQWNNMSLIL